MTTAADSGARLVVLGRITGLFGVRGWVKVFSETEPRENILRYAPWYLGEAGGAAVRPCRVAEGQRQGKGVVVRLEGCEDRDQAATLIGETIAVRRDQLPPARADEFYWIDLEGLAVETVGGCPLGRIDHLFSTAANDVIVVRGERERLLPFVWDDVVKDVDFAQGRMIVDWDPDF
ncbi:ribosome maturation factor RimM [Thiococcus pfennigii]|uniref:ribosome maturation factor RimM n=1 Tax=Thiococcus pfennigii TaxID=1057 RepID=UPI00190363A7|nr:ribosome maturation factor RimM [Thiococcus pfennigii]MBK1700696.1 ribosome maturation factor RimM [Thiococcus pfennigii]MBK1730356.1 ribosome maturation factor RimM [Thiococcus pfennigii]